MAVPGQEMTLKLIDHKSYTLPTVPPHRCVNRKITGFPLSCLQIFQVVSRTFHNPKTFSQDSVTAQQCLHIQINSSYLLSKYSTV